MGAITLLDLREIGQDRKRRRAHGAFLHKELRIRFAQRILELQHLPFRLPERRGIKTVIGWYTNHLLELEESHFDEGAPADENFTKLLTRICDEDTEVIQQVAFAMQDLMADMGPECADVHPEVDVCLRRFFLARIGLRFLMKHHIESWRTREGHSDFIQLDCSASCIAKKAAQDSKMLCRDHLGQAPPIQIKEHVVPGSLTYAPLHLHYMLTEIFKNACRAVVEHHGGSFNSTLPLVTCHIVHGEDNISFRISDEGGGISSSRQLDVWKFMYSTYKDAAWTADLRRSHQTHSSVDSAGNPQQPEQGAPSGVMAGYGVGLMFTRLHAQYFGGDLRLWSREGHGTDVYLTLGRLGDTCENLPQGVLHSSSLDGSSLQGRHGDAQEQPMVPNDELAFFRWELEASSRQCRA